MKEANGIASQSWRNSVSGRVGSLLSHWYERRYSDEEWSEVISDWWAALDGFPAGDVDAACREYVGSHTQRPTPAAIRQCCLDIGRRRERESEKVVVPMATTRRDDPTGIRSDLAWSWLRSAEGGQACLEGWHVSAVQWIDRNNRKPNAVEASRIRSTAMSIMPDLREGLSSSRFNLTKKMLLNGAAGIERKRVAVYRRAQSFHDLPADPPWQEIDLEAAERISA